MPVYEVSEEHIELEQDTVMTVMEEKPTEPSSIAKMLASLGQVTSTVSKVGITATQAALSTGKVVLTSGQCAAKQLATTTARVVQTTGQVVGNVAVTTGQTAGKVAIATISVYTETKDRIRTINEPLVSEIAHGIFSRQISDLLKQMKISSVLYRKIMEKVRNSRIGAELRRTKDILTLLNSHGLSGEVADQFFYGGHFKIEDQGRLYEEFMEIRGAESRFSSHFKDTRINDEKGINAGRILPEVLFLMSKDNDKIYSHFQAEASPWRQVPGNGIANYLPNLRTLQNMEHLYDSAVYFAAKEKAKFGRQTIHNRSNYGWSPYADNNPITSMSKLPQSEKVVKAAL